MEDIDDGLKSDYEILGDLKKEQIARAKRDTGYFKELVLINQFTADIKCKKQVQCFGTRITNLERTKNFLRAFLKICGVIGILITLFATVIGIVKALM